MKTTCKADVASSLKYRNLVVFFKNWQYIYAQIIRLPDWRLMKSFILVFCQEIFILK